jgi:hypothetical protein
VHLDVYPVGKHGDRLGAGRGPQVNGRRREVVVQEAVIVRAHADSGGRGGVVMGVAAGAAVHRRPPLHDLDVARLVGRWAGR